MNKTGMESGLKFVMAGVVSALVGTFALGIVGKYVPGGQLVAGLVVIVAGMWLLGSDNSLFKILGGGLVLAGTLNTAGPLLSSVLAK